nr:TIGR03111 family XrtG-associated glycosyltransferase [uncultured Anaerosporobacter sp.]
MKINDFIVSTIVFYMAWVIIPILLEVIPAIFDVFILFKKRLNNKQGEALKYLPEITVIIPVYNSADTLRNCIKSVYDSDYDNHLIYVMVVHNGGNDNSFEVFSKCQLDFPELNMNWLTSKQGKSKALNLALFNSTGKYIIHIDSDGVLHPLALHNMVTYFEKNEEVHCVTGTILTDPALIEDTDKFFLRILRKLEFCEYAQAFLAGRNFEAEFNNIYTLSGAFSAFRKSTILKTKLYNTDTVCEDTQITFQVREWLNQKVSLCPDAYFFVDPIEDVNKLYTQRQRWQRGELEVAHMFEREKKTFKRSNKRKRKPFNVITKLILYDHTFALPRMIWYFALLSLIFMNYPLRLVIVSMVLIYFFNVMTTFLFYLCIALFLKNNKELRSYYVRKWYLMFLLPPYNSMVFWFRFAGIINAIKGQQVWRTNNLTQEREHFTETIRKDFSGITRILDKMIEKVNKDEE